MKEINLALIGATGIVGRTFLKVLEESNIKIKKLSLYASNKSKGKKLSFRNKEYLVNSLENFIDPNVDFAIFCSNREVASLYAELFEKSGAIVIDNSSYFRMQKDIPLIIPEVNLSDFNESKRKIIANPNCSTIQCVVVLNALKKLKIKRVIYSTYQAISGAGQKAINAYEDILKNKENSYFIYDISKTCIPIIDNIGDNLYSNEEMKMINETKKILHNNKIKISSTCIRVPVLYCHGVNVLVEFKHKFKIKDIYELLKKEKQIKIMDDTENDFYPNSIIAKDNGYVYVGRIRKDLSKRKSLLFYCVSDNLMKGAAYNAYQIMEKIIEMS